MTNPAASPVQIGTVNDLKNGMMKMVRVSGREILLAQVADKYYAANNICPHMGGNLSHGKLEGTIVTCPRHGSQFDLTDGHVVRWVAGSGVTPAILRLLRSPRPLPVYKVKIENGKILLEI